MFRSLLFAGLSALLCSAALPNELFLEGLWPLGFAALVPLYLALQGQKGYKGVFAVGMVFGSLHHALTSYWLFFYKDFAFWTLGSTTLAYSVVYGCAATIGFFILDTCPGKTRPYVFALGWVCLEFLKSIGFLGYPWGLLPYALTSLPIFLQIADITGVYGLSFLLALSSALIVETRHCSWHHRLQHGLFFAFLLSLVLGYGKFSMEKDIPEIKRFRATLVQQNTDPWISGESAALESNMNLARAALGAASSRGEVPADLVVFSETSLRRPYADFTAWFETNPKSEPLRPFLAETGAYLLTGAPIILDWKEYSATNSAILISPSGEQLQDYAKMHPVPFAEAIPFWEYAWFRRFMRETIGLDSGWVMGEKIEIFSFPPPSLEGQTIAFATPICFEDAFADLCRAYVREGAELLINLTNDSWSRKESAQTQHWAIARFRAIENRITLVRSTNAGLSCVVDPWGRNLVEFPQFTAFSATVDIPIHKIPHPSVYTRYGDWFAASCTLLFAAALVILALRRKHEHTRIP
jgi:apolipoprotein N-acyltransferase